MSLIDPLLKSVKYLVQEFHSIGENITDENVYLEQFCVTLEQCFLKGIKKGAWDVTKDRSQSVMRKKFWNTLRSFETDGPMPYNVSSAITTAVEDKRIKTPDGHLRYLIRHCLVNQSIHVLLEFLVSKRSRLKEMYFLNQSCGRAAMQMMAQFGGGSSILIHEELAEQLRSLLLTCSASLTFDLSLKNTYFLDESWQMPSTKTLEFVPSVELGIEMIYINGYAIITKLKPGSLASDSLNLGVGDLLVEMNEKILFPATIGGDKDAISVWRHCKRHSMPCKLTVIKPRSPTTGGIYGPLKETLSEYHDWMDSYFKICQKRLDKKLVKEEQKEIALFQPTKTTERTPILDPDVAEEGAGGRFQVRYIGEVSTGEEGGINQIETVIRQALKKQMERTTFDVKLTLTQIAIEVETLEKNGMSENFFKHKYADISSCGKLISDELHFCYIAGDTFCTISKQFKGYVFKAKSLMQARTMLNGIYQGFKRTTWFM